jgi:hypothetical protein
MVEPSNDRMPDAGKPVSDGQTWADQAGRWDKIRELITHLPSIETPQGVAWFTAREVVGKAGFDDCVIYYLDDERDTLLQ